MYMPWHYIFLYEAIWIFQYNSNIYTYKFYQNVTIIQNHYNFLLEFVRKNLEYFLEGKHKYLFVIFAELKKLARSNVENYLKITRWKALNSTFEQVVIHCRNMHWRNRCSLIFLFASSDRNYAIDRYTLLFKNIFCCYDTIFLRSL